MIDNRDKLRDNLKIGLQNGLKKGWSGFLWMMKIIIPISFLTAVLAWSGWLGNIDYLIAPLMGFLGLPAMAALPIIIGGLTGIYGGIAAMAVLPFTLAEMTLLANFLLICHNLIQEGVIQAQSGLNSIKATLFRIAAAVVTVYAMTFFIQTDPSAAARAGALGASPQAFYAMVSGWGLSMLELTVKIFFIIMTILTLLEIAKSMGWILPIVKALSPFLRILGLSEKVGILWMTAVVFGLAYGGAVIVEEARQGHISKEELEELQLSVGINHSMVEDPFLFMTFGISAFWLWVPRLITAMAATRMLTLWVSFRRKIRQARPPDLIHQRKKKNPGLLEAIPIGLIEGLVAHPAGEKDRSVVDGIESLDFDESPPKSSSRTPSVSFLHAMNSGDAEDVFPSFSMASV